MSHFYCIFVPEIAHCSPSVPKCTTFLFAGSTTGKTLTCTGANASGQTGAGAGIELTQGNTLYLIGGGTVNATGGKAANGGNGGNGDDASYSSQEDAAWVGAISLMIVCPRNGIRNS